MPRYPLPLIILDTEQRQQPNTLGWSGNMEIAADLLTTDGVTSRFHEAGPKAGPMFAEWYSANHRPLVTSFNTAWDKERLASVGVRDLRWAKDILAVVYPPMKDAGVLELLDSTSGRFKWPDLEEAAAFYKVPLGTAHDAEDDANMATKIVQAINNPDRDLPKKT